MVVAGHGAYRPLHACALRVRRQALLMPLVWPPPLFSRARRVIYLEIWPGSLLPARLPTPALLSPGCTATTASTRLVQ